MTPQEHTNLILSTIRQKTNRAILFYSTGKDSIALLDLMSEKFDEVVCVFMYLVKDLEHINKYIRFSENKYSNVKFIERPHWVLSRIHRTGMFCSPQKIRLIRLTDVIQSVRIQTGIKYVFLGEKKTDNLNRRIKLMRYELEAISTTNNVYPLSNWKDGDVLKYIEKKRLPKPINYGKKKNRSVGVAFDVDVYVWLRIHYPDDLKKILKEYPLSEKILFEYDRKRT